MINIILFSRFYYCFLLQECHQAVPTEEFDMETNGDIEANHRQLPHHRSVLQISILKKLRNYLRDRRGRGITDLSPVGKYRRRALKIDTISKFIFPFCYFSFVAYFIHEYFRTEEMNSKKLEEYELCTVFDHHDNEEITWHVW